jgi:hypothetical protein
MAQYPEECPKCHKSMQGEPIPEKYLQHYGKKTHYSRVIALYDRSKDRTTHWKCPDCGHVWERT